jgi:hypothetical protein
VRDYDNQNRTDKQLKGSRIFHRTAGVHDRETIIRARQNQGKVEHFDPVAQKQDRSKQLHQELKGEQKTTDAKPNAATGWELQYLWKNSYDWRPSTSSSGQLPLAHAQPDTEQIEHYSKLGQEKSRT